jgi:hypothetical protein
MRDSKQVALLAMTPLASRDACASTTAWNNFWTPLFRMVDLDRE